LTSRFLARKIFKKAIMQLNVARGKRKKTKADDKIPCILEPKMTDKASRKTGRN